MARYKHDSLSEDKKNTMNFNPVIKKKQSQFIRNQTKTMTVYPMPRKTNDKVSDAKKNNDILGINRKIFFAIKQWPNYFMQIVPQSPNIGESLTQSFCDK